MILCLFDSLRWDFASKYMKNIFPEESWTSFRTIETFTAPIIASVMTGKLPEEIGLKRDNSAFWSELDTSKIDDMLFDHFDSHISIGRLIGNGPREMPPSRREHFKILPPIEWNAVSNWEPDIFQYVGRKWSISSPDWWDLIYWHTFCTHGPFSIFTGEGPKELPEVMNCDRLMQRMTKEELRNWYHIGVNNAIASLMAIKEICNNKETIICFADHGEMLKDDLNEQCTGHVAGMKDIDAIGIVPCWINKPNVKFPDDMSHLKIKDFVIECYKKYELDNPEYQEFKRRKK